MTLVTERLEAITGDACFSGLRDHIIESTGLVFYFERAIALATHIDARIKSLGLNDCREYLDLLQKDRSGESELDRLIELLTIGETYFFRHSEMFDVLRDVALPEILDRNRTTRRLRIWSAGCSIGAETYSVAILLRRDLRHLLAGWDVSIFGTDINRQFLSQAADGCYDEWAFRGTPREFRQDCFQRLGNGWQIASRYKEGVTFQYHNLARHPFPSPAHNLFGFDLILCRNVLIYFGQDMVKRFATQIPDCLAENGWLVVGHAEFNEHFDRHFETVSLQGASLYRRTSSPTIRVELAPTSNNTRFASNPATLNTTSPPVQRDERIRSTCRWAPSAKRHPLPSCAQHGSALPVHTTGVAQIQSLADHSGVDAALVYCAKLLAKDRLNPVYHFYQGLLLDQSNDNEAGLLALQRAIYLDRGFILAHYYVGLAQQRRANTCEAAKSFRNVQQLLANFDPKQTLPHAEGLTAADLSELTCMQMKALLNS